MEPDYDITLNSNEGEATEATKSHFLNSLGLGERDGSSNALEGRREKVEDEGVVLSSLPDDLGFSMTPSEPARGLSLSFSVTRGTEVAAPDSISLPSDEEPAPDPEPAVSENASSSEQADTPAAETEALASDSGESLPSESRDPEAILHLACPECDGALVLKRRHLGVEGACVWCHAAIVAAESGRDGAVRIFPILGVRVPAPEGTTTEEAAEPEAADASEAAVSTSPSEEEPSSWTEPETVAATAPAPAPLNDFVSPINEDVAPTQPWGSVPAAMDDADGSRNDFSPEGSPAVFESESEPIDSGFVANDPPDLDSLYETGGFVAPVVSSPVASLEPAPGSGNETPSFGFAAPASIPSGFGSFLQSSQPLPESGPSADFTGPTPWGPPVRPAATAPTPVKPSTPASAGPDDAPPSALPDGFIPSPPAVMPEQTPTWEMAFGRPSGSTPTPNPEPDEAFASAFGSPFGTGSAETEKESSPFIGFSVATAPAPAPSIPEEDHLPGAPGLANAFSTGSSSWSGPAPSGAGLFGNSGHPGQLPWGSPAAVPIDDAPSLLTPSLAETGFASSPETPFAQPSLEPVNPFGDAPPAAAASPFASLMQAAALPSQPPLPAAPILPPAIPSMAEVSTPSPASTEAAAAPTQQVTSLPLGTKPKPKVRKGFIVLMVVILGFASGAALASYVLPVDRYVEAARSFMEARFAPKAAVPVMPQLNDLPNGAPVTPEDPRTADLQP
jgi:hypothetical protein